MINIVERPSTTGKLIHLSPRDWKSYQGIDNALYEEEQAPEDYGEYDTPDKYPPWARLPKSGQPDVPTTSTL